MRYPWGVLEVAPVDRTGFTVRYLLAVFPPGTNRAESRAMRFREEWPWVGAIAAVMILAAAGFVVPALVAVAGACAIYAAGFVIARRATRRVQSHTRRVLAATHGYGDREPEVEGDLVTLERAALALIALEQRRLLGAETPVDYELEWARVWAALAPSTPRAEQIRRARAAREDARTTAPPVRIPLGSHSPLSRPP